MTKLSFWNYVFYAKGGINWIQSIGLLFLDPWLRQRLHLTPLVNFEYVYLFVALAFIFGLGYWQVGNDLNKNRAVVRMGVFGQYSVCFILMFMVLFSRLHWLYLIPGLIDGVFASLYLWYLHLTSTLTPLGDNSHV